MILAGNSDKESFVKYLHLSINVGQKRKKQQQNQSLPSTPNPICLTDYLLGPR